MLYSQSQGVSLYFDIEPSDTWEGFIDGPLASSSLWASQKFLQMDSFISHLSLVVLIPDVA